MYPIVPDFLQPLVVLSKRFEKEACDAALARWDEAVPHLIAGIEWACENVDETEDYIFHDYAMFLLAEKRETRGLSALVRMARHPKADNLLGDVITTGLPGALAAVVGEDWEALESVALDPEADEFARAGATRAFVISYLEGRISREALSERMGRLLLKLEREPGYIWPSLAMVAADFRFVEHASAILAAYADGLCDEFIFPINYFEADVSRPFSETDIRADRDYASIGSCESEMSGWLCFREDADDEDFVEGEYLPPPGFGDPIIPRITPPPSPVRAEAVPGRNDPCPCGSGRKYKKCCGAAR